MFILMPKPLGYAFSGGLAASAKGASTSRRAPLSPPPPPAAQQDQAAPPRYTSRCILGHDLRIEELCDVIASVGVLCTDPGAWDGLWGLFS
jgi:hypothetical protein